MKLLGHVSTKFKKRRIHIIADILLANTHDKATIPDYEELSRLATIADAYLAKNDNLTQILGSVEQSLLWKTTLSIGMPYNKFLLPPTDNCLKCGTVLQAHHQPTTVVCYICDGPLLASKLTLRYKNCSINYRYKQYGDSKCGYRYYSSPRPLVHC